MDKNQIIPAGWVPRRRYPPFCPGTGEACRGTDCEAAQDYSWCNVFLSIPFGKRYAKKRQVLEETLQAHKLVPITADRTAYGNTLAQNIAGCVCSSAHAIVELSCPKGRITASGVLCESGFVRTMIPKGRMIFVGKHGTKTAPELDGYLRFPYSSGEELKKVVDRWAKTKIDPPLEAVKRILFSSGGCTKYKICFHCRFETHKGPGGGDAPPKQALSGGGSGSQLIRSAFERLRKMDRSMSRHNIEKRALNTDKVRPPKPFQIESEAKCRNLYLLDAPIAQGPKWKHGLNWVTDGLLRKIARQNMQELSVGFQFLERNDTKEEKKIVVGAKEEWKANPQEDYGVIVRVRNPCFPSAFALILAGIHAPASHAAAEIVVTPTLARSLLNYVYKGCELPNELYFAAVFSVRRTHFPDGLGTPQWVYGERLD